MTRLHFKMRAEIVKCSLNQSSDKESSEFANQVMDMSCVHSPSTASSSRRGGTRRCGRYWESKEKMLYNKKYTISYVSTSFTYSLGSAILATYYLSNPRSWWLQSLFLLELLSSSRSTATTFSSSCPRSTTRTCRHRNWSTSSPSAPPQPGDRRSTTRRPSPTGYNGRIALW